MSEDRMDRAERIRNMREGSRGTDDESADDEGDETQPESASDETTTESASTQTETELSTSESASAQTGSEPSTTESVASGTPESATDTSTGATPSIQDTSPTETVPSADDGSDERDPAAVAQRAAAAAADVAGDETAADVAGAEPAAEAMSEDAGTVPAAGLQQGPTGVELPDQQLLEEAMSQSSVQTTEGGARAAIGEETTQAEELVRVLEFALGDEYYCLDIEYVEEIVKRDAVTRVPNTPDFVDGVVDLRGQITTILEPKEMMDIDAEGSQNLIIVFDPDKFEDQGAVGWVVDEVRQVIPITEGEVNSPPVDAEYINGVIDREDYDQFVIWIEPDDALAQATASDDE